ncbi:MAG: hypothetical protein LQ352_006459, partial [Teloschistes flavicans]
MRSITELISEYNSADKSILGTQQTLDIARWVTSIVNTFGLNGSAKADDRSIGWSGISIPDYAKPYLSSISQIRDTLRQTTRSSKPLTTQNLKDIAQPIPNGHQPPTTDEAAAPYAAVLSTFRSDISALTNNTSDALQKDILHLCDRIRDTDLWDLGIYLEDRPAPQPALIRPVTRELRTARTEQETLRQQKQTQKEDQERKVAEEKERKAEKGRLSHKEMFRTGEWG